MSDRRLVPEPEGPALDRFRLRTVSGLRALLHSLADHQVLAGLFDGDRLVVSVRIAAADATGLTLQLARETAAPRPLDGRRLMLVAFLDDVKVQLPVTWSERFRSSGHAWSVPYPDVVWRMQRRRGYRVRPPRERAVWVRVRGPEGVVNLRAEDLSVVGLGLRMGGEGVPPEVGTTWEDVQLHLVHDGVPHLVPCSLVIRRVAGGVGQRPWRLGCALEGLPLPSAHVLHQFVVDLELADRARRFASAPARTADPG